MQGRPERGTPAVPSAATSLRAVRSATAAAAASAARAADAAAADTAAAGTHTVPPKIDTQRPQLPASAAGQLSEPVHPTGPVPAHSVRFLTWSSLRWAIRHRAITPWYLVRYWRLMWVRLTKRHVILLGMVFLDRGSELYARRGYGRLIVEPWVHLGVGTALRCHEGTLRVGTRGTFGRGTSVNCYLDVQIGENALIADNVYISDFDHRFTDLRRPIREQGIVKSRVRIAPDVWLGTKVTVARGVAIGRGTVVGANAVVTRDVPAYSVAVGVPARVIRDRRT